VSLHPCSAVIVAGDAERGLDMRPSLAQHGERRALDRLMTTLEPLFDDIIIVAADPASCLDWNALIVSPHAGGNSVLEALHAGLFAARHPHALATWCRMPAPQPALIETLRRAVEPRWDAVVGCPGGKPALLPGIYSRRCLAALALHMAHNDHDVDRFLSRLHLTSIAEDDLRKSDPQLQSFLTMD
jgi:molybdenum cofactor guanylyltransferase